MLFWQILLIPNQDNGAAGAGPAAQQVRGRNTLWTGHHDNTHTHARTHTLTHSLTHSQQGPVYRLSNVQVFGLWEETGKKKTHTDAREGPIYKAGVEPAPK